MIEFRLDRGTGVPPYRQLMDQVEHALRLGMLSPGDQLPTVREVVESLAINPNTVLKAYRELEGKGLVGGRPGLGTFVQQSLGDVPLATYATLRRGLVSWLRGARSAGLDDDGVVALFSTVLHASAGEGAA